LPYIKKTDRYIKPILMSFSFDLSLYYKNLFNHLKSCFMHNISIGRPRRVILSSAFVLFSLVNIFATFGLDTYSIYLNNKLLFKQAVDQSATVYNFELNEANSNDVINIRYSQCNAPEKIGRGRSISLRNVSGSVVKEWRFKNEPSNEMTIPVRELLQYQKAGVELTLYYSAQGLDQGQKLASL
jgi:hypothetical protein